MISILLGLLVGTAISLVIVLISNSNKNNTSHYTRHAAGRVHRRSSWDALPEDKYYKNGHCIL